MRSEKEAVGVWQKVMLFRRLFEDVGGAVFVDLSAAFDLVPHEILFKKLKSK